MREKRTPIFIESKDVKLLPINLEHLNLYQKWENDPKVRLYARNVVPLTADDLRKRLEPSKENTKSILWFEIFYNPENRPIGTCEIGDINWYNRTAILGILIGEPGLWGKNICTEVINLLNEYAFNELNMRKLSFHVFAPNIGSWRCAEKSGYVREAILKEDVYIDGKYEDTLIYSLFKEDWLKTRH